MSGRTIVPKSAEKGLKTFRTMRQETTEKEMGFNTAKTI